MASVKIFLNDELIFAPKGVEQSGFFVLLQSKMGSLIKQVENEKQDVELVFLTRPEEDKENVKLQMGDTISIQVDME